MENAARAAATAVLLGAAQAHGQSLAPQPLDGTLALVAVDGQPLPARVLEVSTRDGRGSGCYMVMPSGWLTLDRGRGVFSMGARKRDTCGVTSFGGDMSATGRYAWRDGRPQLVVQPGDSPAEEFPTRLAGDTVEVYDTYTHTRYRYRPARAGAAPAAVPAPAHPPSNEALQLTSAHGRSGAPADARVRRP